MKIKDYRVKLLDSCSHRLKNIFLERISGAAPLSPNPPNENLRLLFQPNSSLRLYPPTSFPFFPRPLPGLGPPPHHRLPPPLLPAWPGPQSVKSCLTVTSKSNYRNQKHLVLRGPTFLVLGCLLILI